MGQFTPDARFESPEFRDRILQEHAAGASLRELAGLHPGRSRSALGRDLARAREERRVRDEQARRDELARAERVEVKRDALVRERWAAAPPVEPERTSRVLVVSGTALEYADGTNAKPSGLRPPSMSRRSRDGLSRVLNDNDRSRLLERVNVRAGLTPAGYASAVTRIGRYSYDVRDPADVERVRMLIRQDDGDAAADAWQPVKPPLS